MSQIVLLTSWRELTGDEPTGELLNQRLSEFRIDSVFAGLSRVAALLRTWRNEVDFAADRILVKKFLPSFASRIQQLYRSNENRVVFSRIGLLFVAKRALLICSKAGRDVGSDHDVEKILSCCLIANDLLLPRDPRPSDGAIEKAAALLPFVNYMADDAYPAELARSLLIFEEIAPLLSDRRDYIDLNAEFRRATGLPVREYCELTFGAFTKLMINVEEQAQDLRTAFVITPEYFQKACIDFELVTRFLSDLSIQEETLGQVEQFSGTFESDFLVFQRRPLVEYVSGAFLCPDPGFLLNKAGRSIAWTLLEGEPKRRRQTLLNYWSKVIERYAEWLFATEYHGTGKWAFSPRFDNGDQAFDCYLIEGSSLLIFEVKASTLSSKAKYGFSANDLRCELEKKTITGEEGKRKGLAQLYAGVNRFLRGDAIPGVERAKIKIIYPILVFLDSSFTSPYLNAVYNQNFDRSRLRELYRCKITPVFSLTIADLEHVLPYTKEYPLNAILHSFWQSNKAELGNLSHSGVPLLQGRQFRSAFVYDRFKRFSRDMQERFFRSADIGTPAN